MFDVCVSLTFHGAGLTALKADEVHDLMGRDYPAKYKASALGNTLIKKQIFKSFLVILMNINTF